MTEPVWIVYDERAIFGTPEDADILETFGVEEGVDDDTMIRFAKDNWRGYAWALYRYDLDVDTREADNGRMILAHQV